jgi:hypothetical protein
MELGFINNVRNVNIIWPTSLKQAKEDLSDKTESVDKYT